MRRLSTDVSSIVQFWSGNATWKNNMADTQQRLINEAGFYQARHCGVLGNQAA